MNSLWFNRLRTRIESEIDAFERRLLKLEAENYPTDVGIELVNDLHSEIQAEKARLPEVAQLFARDPRGARDELSNIHRKLVFDLVYLRWLDGAATYRVPWSFVETIERFAHLLLPGRKILTTCSYSSTYKIDCHPDPQASGLDRYGIVEIPPVSRLNALLHILVGHELFHPLVHEFIERAVPRVSLNLIDPCKALLEKWQPQDLPLLETIRLDGVVKRTAEIWERSLVELMCDMGCAELFGPSAIFALWNVGLLSKIDDLPDRPDYYPPFRFRLRTVLTYPLGSDKARKAIDVLTDSLAVNHPQEATQLSSELEYLRSEAEDNSDISAITSHPFLSIAYTEVQRVLGEAWEFVREIVSAQELSWIASVAEVPSHLRRLKMRVPSGEVNRDPESFVGKSASPSAIALAAWLENLATSDGADGTLIGYRSLASFQTSCRLLLKSWEDAELKRTFEAVTSDQ